MDPLAIVVQSLVYITAALAVVILEGAILIRLAQRVGDTFLRQVEKLIADHTHKK